MTATKITPICPKCAAIKTSGKFSCCAPGGAWFENCGASDNSNADHTWVEGVQACKHVVANFFSDRVEAQFISVNQTTTTQPLADSSLTAAYNVPAGNSKGDEQLSHIIVFTSVLFVVSFNMQTW